ncbi:cytochrome c oxidase assembly protein [Anditalea andensis]|uniref:Cytochrome C oxidase assembly protein n=1 Tax=Anditalea andensis TaxID=1048983 RepID=A0A074L2Q0_9BACT|nr:cytochrome c oxidase assembly protein [Anditalea andensis]KEO74108.1 hypothetical protein EL17_08160 [Anditalea andensis]
MHDHPSHHMPPASIGDWIPLVIIVFVGLLYSFGWAYVIWKKRNWNSARGISFLIGTLLLFIAMWPDLVKWAHHDLRGHMVQHLLIGMFAPIFLVMGAPVTLALKTCSKNIAEGITYLLRSFFFHIISHPLTAMFLNLGGMYVLYLTPIYNATIEYPILHHAIHIHFLMAGYLFTWAIIGPDPAPARPGLVTRLAVLFASIAAHAFLSKLMYAHLYPLNSPHGKEEIQEAAKLMYYWGDLSEFILIIILFALWYYKRGRPGYDLSPLLKWS